MNPRFYHPELGAHARARLARDEAHHLARVLRLRPGDPVTLFDGRGLEAQARVASVQGDAVELSVEGLRQVPDDNRPAVILAVAVPKADRLAWLVEKATELGVARVIPLVASRSVVHPGSAKLDKLRRTVVEASKQCGRSRLMILDEPISWGEFVARESPAGTLLIAEPAGEPYHAGCFAANRPVLFAVGPEGGFTADELAAGVRGGGRLVSLGPLTLRVETAAVALAALARVGGGARDPQAAVDER